MAQPPPTSRIGVAYRALLNPIWRLIDKHGAMEGSEGTDGPETIILGAGFSHAVSDRMPLTDSLGDLVLDHIGRDAIEAPERFTSGYFESWLSRLAEDQPDLDPAENLSNRSLFFRIADAITHVLTERQRAAWNAGLPSWFVDLASVWHAERTALVSFNWDTLIELAIDGHRLFDWDAHSYISWASVIGLQPPPPPGIGPELSRGAVAGARSARLIKLHGSLNWLWSTQDQTGTTICRWWRADPPITQEDRLTRSRNYPGRSPFIVPPTSSKGPFFSNPLTRELWQQAGAAISSSSRIALIGYSLPPTDLTAAGLIGDRLRASSAVIDIVNPRHEAVVANLVRLGIDQDRIQPTPFGEGERFPSQYVRDAASRASARAVAALLDCAVQFQADPTDMDRLPLIVASDPGSALTDAGGVTTVGALTRSGRTLVLQLGLGIQDWARREFESPGSSSHRTFRDLIDELSSGRVDTIDAADGRRIVSFANSTLQLPVALPGQLGGQYLVLVPMGSHRWEDG